jgi:hypothetical protein
MPQLVSAREFLCSFPEPVHDPTILFTVEGHPHAKDVRFYSFVPARAEKMADVAPKRVQLVLAGWVLPRSGVLFTWH